MNYRTECNICGSDKFTIKYKYSDYSIVRCLNCKTDARDRIFDRKESEELYSKDYFCDLQYNFFYENIDIRERAFKRKIEYIEKVCPEKGKLLDLGCATGLFMSVARDRGWDVTGVELSQFAAEEAVSKRNLKVYNSDLIDLNLPEESFDVITMWDMVDHSESPNDIVKEVYRLLKPGGIVALDTFMADALLFSIANSVYSGTFGLINYPSKKAHPLHHSHHFSHKTFKYLLESNDFSIIFSKSFNLEGAVVSLGAIGKMIVSLSNIISSVMGKEFELLLIGKK